MITIQQSRSHRNYTLNQGICVETVKPLESFGISGKSDQELQARLQRLRESFNPTTVAYVATAGWEPPPNDNLGHAEALRVFLQLDLKDDPLPTTFTPEYEFPGHSSTHIHRPQLFGHYYRHMTHNRRLFVTTSGMPGIAPAGMGQDDVLEIFSDNKGYTCCRRHFSFILRPVNRL